MGEIASHFKQGVRAGREILVGNGRSVQAIVAFTHTICLVKTLVEVAEDLHTPAVDCILAIPVNPANVFNGVLSVFFVATFLAGTFDSPDDVSGSVVCGKYQSQIRRGVQKGETHKACNGTVYHLVQPDQFLDSTLEICQPLKNDDERLTYPLNEFGIPKCMTNRTIQLMS